MTKGTTMDLDPTAIDTIKLIVASAAGGVVRLCIKPAQSIAQNAIILAACIICGTYGTEPILDYLDLPQSYSGGVGAALGLVGVTIAEKVLSAIEGLSFKDIIERIIKK